MLDADIWGFSVPRMLGMDDRLEAQVVEGSDRPLILPNERAVGAGLLKVVSTGLLVEDEGTALMWRGLMLTKAVEQFLRDVHWGPLDYLLIDMPPGTGDVQMGLARLLPRTDLIIVTTPAVSAQKVAIRAADMARRSFLRVAGVIENMSTFTCEHGTRYALFGEGGGQALADEVGVELLGQVPIEPAVAAGGDTGEPVALDRHGTGGRRLPRHRPDHRHRDGAPGRHGRLLGPPARRRRGGARPGPDRARLSSRRSGCAGSAQSQSRGRPSSSGRPSNPASSGQHDFDRGRRRRAAASAGWSGAGPGHPVPRARRPRCRRAAAARGSSWSGRSSPARPARPGQRLHRPHPQAGDGLVVVVERLLRLRSPGEEEPGVEPPPLADRE